MKKKIKKNKLLIKLLIIITIASLIGILYIAILSKSNKEMIKDNLELFFSSLEKLNYKKGIINSLASNFTYTVLIWIIGISIIGIPIIYFLLILKSFILGFTISSIIYFYKFKGILIAIIYCIPLVLNLFLLIILGYYGIIFSKNINKLLFLKSNINFKEIMKNYIKILGIILVGIILSSIIEIYLIPNILKLLQI